MSAHNQELEIAILNWISTLTELSHKPENFESLSDGIVLTEIMNRIEPTIFNLSKVNMDISDNWALRLTNLAYLYEGLENYYTNILNKFFDKTYVDVVKVSKNNDKEDLYNLVEIVLGATVQCPDKEKYINAILALDESCQNALMDLIEKILHKCNPEQSTAEPDANTSFENTITRGSNVSMTLANKFEVQEKKLLIKLEELENENQSLNLRFNEMAQEKDHLKIRVNELIQEVDKKTEEVKKLLQDREEIQEKMNTQDSIEELKNEIKLKDYKLEQLEHFIEELKQKQEGEIARLEDEVDKQKKRVQELTKVEAEMGYYIQQAKDYSQLEKKLSEVEQELEKYKVKLDSLNKSNESLQSKNNIYKEKIEAEKTKNISLDIELTKKQIEIETLKSEKKRLEVTNGNLEAKVHDQNRAIEKSLREHEDTVRHYTSNDRTMNQFAGQDFREIMVDLEKQNMALKSEAQEGNSGINEGEKEILQQENNILKAKCKEIQIQNEELRNNRNEDKKIIEKLKEEVDKIRNMSQGPMKKVLDDEAISLIKDEVNEKTRLIGQLTEEIVGLKGNNQKATKKLEEEVEKKSEEIRELNDELEAMRSILTEVGDQKEEELKVLAAAVQELALRNLELERQVSSRPDGVGSLVKTNHNSASVSQSYKQRK